MRPFALALFLLCAPQVLVADIIVRFYEGAPKDRFTIEYLGACMHHGSVVTIDLAPAPAGLVFDVTSSGPGIEVYQPFRIVSGGGLLAHPPVVRDGDQSIVLRFADLKHGAKLAFSIDIDDTASLRGITVSDSEIFGAQVTVVMEGQTHRGSFGDGAQARVPSPDCIS